VTRSWLIPALLLPVLLAPPGDAAAATSPGGVVLLLGDSMLEYGGLQLEAMLEAAGFDAQGQYRASTGFCRWDYFDWRPEMRRQVVEQDPLAVVVFIGANDAQDCYSRKGTLLPTGTAEWSSLYGRRVGAAMRVLHGDGRLVLWVTEPAMASARLEAVMAEINRLAEARAPQLDGVSIVDTRAIFGQEFSVRIPDPGGAGTVYARTGDGVHFTHAGSQLLADTLFAAIEGFAAAPVPAQASTAAPNMSRSAVSTASTLPASPSQNPGLRIAS